MRTVERERERQQQRRSDTRLSKRAEYRCSFDQDLTRSVACADLCIVPRPFEFCLCFQAFIMIHSCTTSPEKRLDIDVTFLFLYTIKEIFGLNN